MFEASLNSVGCGNQPRLGCEAQKEFATLKSGAAKEAVTILMLENSGLYEHFLERFLKRIADFLRVPWWIVHVGLYLITSLAFLQLFDIHKLYPRAGYMSYDWELIGEAFFTTFMLLYLRFCRAMAFGAAAKITNMKYRAAWLRRYLAPTCLGWHVAIRRKDGGVAFSFMVRVSSATVIVVLAYYLRELIWHPHERSWVAHYYLFPQLIYLYVTLAKAAMMIAVLAQLWWLRGMMSIIGGEFPNGLTPADKRSFYFECCRAATRLTLLVSVGALAWMFGHGLGYGISNGWSFAYSLCLLGLFTAQVAVLKGLSVNAWVDLKSAWSAVSAWVFRAGEMPSESIRRLNELFLSITGLRKIPGVSRFVVFAVWLSIACFAPSNLLGNYLREVFMR